MKEEIYIPNVEIHYKILKILEPNKVLLHFHLDQDADDFSNWWNSVGIEMYAYYLKSLRS